MFFELIVPILGFIAYVRSVLPSCSYSSESLVLTLLIALALCVFDGLLH